MSPRDEVRDGKGTLIAKCPHCHANTVGTSYEGRRFCNACGWDERSKASLIDVYYVTAVMIPKGARDIDAVPRSDMGKFFDEGHANAHREVLRAGVTGAYDIRVELRREEPEADTESDRTRRLRREKVVVSEAPADDWPTESGVDEPAPVAIPQYRSAILPPGPKFKP